MFCCPCFFWRKRNKVFPIVDDEESVSTAESHTENPELCEATAATTSEISATAPENQEFKGTPAKSSPVLGGAFPSDSRHTENPELCKVTVTTTSEITTTATETPATTVISKEIIRANEDKEVSVGLTSAATENQCAVAEKQHSLVPVSTEQMEREEEQSLVRAQQLINRGLINFRNSCYVNATLQSLFSAESFCTQFSNQLSDWIYAPGAELIRCFVELWWMRETEDRKGKSLLLREFVSAAAATNPEFTVDTQNDAHEFLFHCLREMMAFGQTLSWSGLEFECPVRAHFEFQLVCIITCGGCGAQKRRMEEFNHLTLALPPSGSVKDCLDLFFSDEKEIECRCGVCKYNSASCRWVFHTLPRILVLQLKRFHVSAASIQKQHGEIDIDTKLQLTLPEQSCPQEASEDPHNQEATPTQPVYLGTPPNGQQNTEERRTERNELGDSVFNYSLISVLNHIGETINAGHYTSDCYSQSDSCWLSCDDEKVTLTMEERVLSQRRRTAYLLFYQGN